MSEDKNKNSIDLSEIDWNNLSPEQFNKIELELQRQNRILKANKPRSERIQGYVLVKIQDQDYKIKKVLYQRLKDMKSIKSRQKLIEEIISTQKPIERI